MVGYGSLERQRNDLAHGCFGVCPDDEDLLFVISVEHHVLWQADILPKLAKIGSEGSMPVPDPHQGLQENMYVYRLKEIERLHAEMEEQWWDMFYFNGYLRQRNDHRRVAEFQRLFTSPRIQQRMSQTRSEG
jgi:hypothetical protein